MKMFKRMKGAKPTINVIGGKARYIGTEIEDENGNWNDDYNVKDGYYVIHQGNKHHIYLKE